MNPFILPKRLQPGDRVAIVSPASGTASLFPWVYKLALERLVSEFQLVPVEYPTALKSSEYLWNHPEERAEDINNAFADSSISAVMATLGGYDQIRILPYIDVNILKQHPKIFTGFSDNTNLHMLLWNAGIISYYGGNLLTQFAMQGSMHEYTKQAIHKAFFEDQIGEIVPSLEWTDTDLDWSDESLLTAHRPMQKNNGWLWHNADGKQIYGRLWGGCLEILLWHMLADRYLPSKEQLKDTVLYIETSEELPSADLVYRFITGLGIRGLLSGFSGMLVGRPKTQFLGNHGKEEKEVYAQKQKQSILKAVQEYAPELPIVFDLDFGHTDPQMLIPNGGKVHINGATKQIKFTSEE